MGERRLVFPDARDFPDPFTGDEESARQLLARMQGHAGMDDIPISLRVVAGSVEASTSCSSGACATPSLPSSADLARVVDDGNGWALNIPSPELQHPVFLTTGLARSLALIFMLETEQAGDQGPDPFTLEIAAIQLGFGGLLLQGAHVYQKSCGGPRIDQFTAFNVHEVALLCTVMALDSGSGLGRLPRLVEATQSAALGEARQFLESRSRFLRLLAEDPARAAEDSFAPEPAQGLWNKLKTRLQADKRTELPGTDHAWRKALQASVPNGPAESRKLPSQELRELVKSEL